MEQIKLKIKNASLKQLFISMVLCTVLLILLLSGLSIWGCIAFQSWLLPDSDQVMVYITRTYADGRKSQRGMLITLNEPEQISLELLADNSFSEEHITQAGNSPFSYDINDTNKQSKEVSSTLQLDRIENSYSSLTPKRKLAYTGSSVLMVVLPLLYSIAGIMLCAMFFYQWKLDQPILILNNAAENIGKQNLDFSIVYDSADEMGMLCGSFEKMRTALAANYQELWNLLAERKRLQASVAHDLRNPIAIIEGYTEYLSLNLPAGTISQDKLLEVISCLQDTAKRMEAYTDSIRDINCLEELVLQPVYLSLPELAEEAFAVFSLIAEHRNKKVTIKNTISQRTGMLDKQAYYRILENMFSNALRYASSSISLFFALEGDTFITILSDDGPGFPESLLAKNSHCLPTMNPSSEHLGMGIPVSRILCKKHGGELKLSNLPSGGAEVTIRIVID